MNNEIYYVVKRGIKPGIYKTWPECKAAVNGYKNPIFKKFTSFNDANTFYKNNSDTNTQILSTEDNIKIKQLTSNIQSNTFNECASKFDVKEWVCINNELFIFVDGSARKPSIQSTIPNSGIGLFVGHKCTNIKEQFINKTNNQCELIAMDYAFKLIVMYSKELAELGKVIKIVSDSEYCIKACSSWIIQWKKNNWHTCTGDEVKNRELIESIDTSMTYIKMINSSLADTKKIKVKLIHINSHQPPNLQDEYKFNIWLGNYIADALAQNIT